MFRFVRQFVLVIVVAAAAAAAVLLLRSPDPYYAVQEWAGFSSYDALIRRAAQKYGVDPMLVKAIVWRESRFSPEKVGTSGERGLMQVTEGAASDWARAEKIETFVPTDLFDAQNNLEAGTWYVRNALEHWKKQDDPVPFALAEYNAGRQRVIRWVALTKGGEHATAAEFLSVMDFPGTRQYIEDVVERRRYYQARGRL
jgi:soluble lytic murein transglycosylase